MTAKKPTAAQWCFPKGTVPFLKKLRTNNNREWFTENKSRFARDVQEPAAEFCTLMEGQLEKLTGLGHASKIFRRLMGTGCMLRWREAAERERIWTVAPGHPICEGLEDEYFELRGEPGLALEHLYKLRILRKR